VTLSGDLLVGGLLLLLLSLGVVSRIGVSLLWLSCRRLLVGVLLLIVLSVVIRVLVVGAGLLLLMLLLGSKCDWLRLCCLAPLLPLLGMVMLLQPALALVITGCCC
jgi:hypothetical protein